MGIVGYHFLALLLTHVYPIRFEILPRTTDVTLAKLLLSERTLFYKLPQLYQHKQEGSWGIYPTHFLQDFNANLDFPWETTVGLNFNMLRTDNPYSIVNFLWLPPDSPILVHRGPPVRWFYPEGAVVGEVIMVTHKGRRYIQEIRTRTKESSLAWEPNIYRPVANRAEFIKRTGDDSRFLWKVFLRNPEQDEVARLEGTIERLPYLPEEVVTRLLSLPLKDVTHSKWSNVSYAPSAPSDFHIVPNSYAFGVLRPSRLTCMRCHRQTQISVRHLIPNEPLIKENPTKVGHIRGCDGIFTWHPFAEEALPHFRLRPYDVQHKVVVEYDDSMYDKKRGVVTYQGHDYVLTKAVQDSVYEEALPDRRFLHK